MIGTMSQVLWAALAFVGGHFVLSWQPVRGAVVARLGERGFTILYSTLAVLTLLWLGRAYGTAPYVELWGQPPWTRWIPIVVMPLALLLAVCGLSQANPTMVEQKLRPASDDPAPGILKVTRHPVMWSFGLWALAHLPPNGDLASLMLFGALGTLSLLGTRAIDAKRHARDPEGFARFAAATSNLPLAAILAGRQRLSFADIGWARLAAAIVIYFALLHGHRWVAGVPLF